jgi:hypothetical protein
MAKPLYPWFLRVVLLATLNADPAAAIGGGPNIEVDALWPCWQPASALWFVCQPQPWTDIGGNVECVCKPMDWAGLGWTVLGEVAPSGCFYPGPSQV